MEDTNNDFEQVNSGSSHTYPQQAGAIRKGMYIMIKGRPCRVNDVSTSKTGKHGHAKNHFVTTDIFTGKRLEEISTTSENALSTSNSRPNATYFKFFKNLSITSKIDYVSFFVFVSFFFMFNCIYFSIYL